MGIMQKIKQRKCNHTAEFYDERILKCGKKKEKKFKCTKCGKILSYTTDV